MSADYLYRTGFGQNRKLRFY